MRKHELINEHDIIYRMKNVLCLTRLVVIIECSSIMPPLTLTSNTEPTVVNPVIGNTIPTNKKKK